MRTRTDIALSLALVATIGCATWLATSERDRPPPPATIRRTATSWHSAIGDHRHENENAGAKPFDVHLAEHIVEIELAQRRLPQEAGK